MKFVIGGAYQGKKKWVKSQWLNTQNVEKPIVDGNTCPLSDFSDIIALSNFHMLVKRWILEGIDPKKATQQLLIESPDLILISDEIGGGIVPMDRNEREWREVHGRVCCEIAKEAECVVRVFCGIGNRIK